MAISVHVAHNRVLMAVAVVCGTLVVAGCGSSSKPSTSASGRVAAGIKYADCMRSHGVSNFPDPNSSDDFILSSVNTRAPAFQGAQTTCDKLYPSGTPSSGAFSAATDEEFLTMAHCMRAHGVSRFPDPTTTPPSNTGAGTEAFTENGVSFVITSTINIRSPAVKRAASTCHLPGVILKPLR